MVTNIHAKNPGCCAVKEAEVLFQQLMDLILGASFEDRIQYYTHSMRVVGSKTEASFYKVLLYFSHPKVPL